MRRSGADCGSSRGQANIPVVAVALVVLTAVTGMTLAMAEGAYLSAERDADERATAVALGDRLVASDADHTRRQNVLDAGMLETMTDAAFTSLVPAMADADVRIRVGEAVVFERGDPDGGTTVRRIALVADDESWDGSVGVGPEDETILPHGTASIVVDGGNGVDTVRVGGRVVVHEPVGSSEPTEPIHVQSNAVESRTVTATGSGGEVGLEATVETTETNIVAVTVDD